MKAALWTLVILVAVIGVGLFVFLNEQARQQEIAACEARYPYGSVAYFLCDD